MASPTLSSSPAHTPPGSAYAAWIAVCGVCFSAPFFFNPAYSTQYAPLPSTVDAEHPPRYRPIGWGEFRDWLCRPAIPSVCT